MKRAFLSLMFMLFFITALPVHAAEIQTFILKDGSKIRGQLIELTNNVYIIKTADGAQTRIRAKKIAKILTPKKKTAQAKKPEPLDPLTELLAAHPKIMEDVANFKDPLIFKTLEDPAFQSALQEIKDPKQLETDPRTKEFYANPEIKSLLKKYKKSKKTIKSPAASNAH